MNILRPFDGKLILLFAVLLAGCHSPKTATKSTAELLAARTNYSTRWWTPVSTNGAPSWEILPQAATPFTFHDQRYASLEGFWQMMKYPESGTDPRAMFPGLHWGYTRAEVAQLTAFDAKRAGDAAERNMKAMGITWVTFEGARMEYRAAGQSEFYNLIVAATWQKVRQNPEVNRVLLATGDLILKPDHRQETNAPAAWRYYEILTQIRTALQQKP